MPEGHRVDTLGHVVTGGVNAPARCDQAFDHRVYRDVVIADRPEQPGDVGEVHVRCDGGQFRTVDGSGYPHAAAAQAADQGFPTLLDGHLPAFP